MTLRLGLEVLELPLFEFRKEKGKFLGGSQYVFGEDLLVGDKICYDMETVVQQGKG